MRNNPPRSRIGRVTDCTMFNLCHYIKLLNANNIFFIRLAFMVLTVEMAAGNVCATNQDQYQKPVMKVDSATVLLGYQEISATSASMATITLRMADAPVSFLLLQQ